MTGAIDVPGAPGWVLWMTGLSGSGKTTVGRLLVGRLRARGPNVVFLDGDVLRQVFDHDLGYALEDRRRLARRYSRLSKMLADQGHHVVVATISMFHECRRWNRAHVARYYEVYLCAPRSLLLGRRARTTPSFPSIAERFAEDAGTRDDQVVGIDLPWEEPLAPDLVVDDDGGLTPEDVADRIWTAFGAPA